MNNFKSYIFVILIFINFSIIESANASVAADPGASQFPDVHKVDNDHYIGKLPNVDFYVGMERLTQENHKKWLDFVEPQANDRANKAWYGGGSGVTGGASQFMGVINLLDHNMGQAVRWVAVVTSSPDIPFKPEDVVMYVTITTSPKSLVTTHMGITSVVDLQKLQTRKRPPGISMDLHSFAAKVMLMQNPSRLFMVNIPVFAMASIMLKEMPKGSVHFGSFESQKSVALTFEEYIKSPKAQNDITSKKQYAERKLKNLLRNIQEGYFLNAEELKEEVDKIGYLKKVDDKTYIIDPEKLEQKIQKDMPKLFESVQNAIKISPGVGKSNEKSDLEKLMHDNPPIISGDHTMDSLTIFSPTDPQNILIEARKGDPTYGFLFLSPFRIFGSALNYVAVDLDKLANVRPLDPSFK